MSPPAAEAIALSPSAEQARGPAAAGAMRFGPFPITETVAFPPPCSPACWIYVTLNAEIALSLPRSRGLQCLLTLARTRISIDGQWVLWALRRKYPNHAPAKMSGSDLIFQIARHCAAQGKRLMLLGSSPQIIEAATFVLEQRNPGLQVAGHAPGFYGLDSLAEQAVQHEVLDKIQVTRPDYVVLGLGAMKEHRLAAEIAPLLDGQVTGVLCFGGAIDIAAGAYRRAPPIWQRCGLEGLYRVWQHPSRWGRLVRVLRILPLLALRRY